MAEISANGCAKDLDIDPEKEMPWRGTPETSNLNYKRGSKDPPGRPGTSEANGTSVRSKPLESQNDGPVRPCPPHPAMPLTMTSARSSHAWRLRRPGLACAIPGAELKKGGHGRDRATPCTRVEPATWGNEDECGYSVAFQSPCNRMGSKGKESRKT